MAGKRIAPLYRAADGFRIGIQEQLGRIEAMAFGWRVGAMDPVAIGLTGADIRQIGMPYPIALLPQLNPLSFDFILRVMEQAQLDSVPVLREKGKIGPLPIPGSTQWSRLPGPDPDQTILINAALNGGSTRVSEPTLRFPSPP